MLRKEQNVKPVVVVVVIVVLHFSCGVDSLRTDINYGISIYKCDQLIVHCSYHLPHKQFLATRSKAIRLSRYFLAKVKTQACMHLHVNRFFLMR